ncbi:MAG: NfeD family protein [Pseudomonadota bacterium]|nr:NfeD family protein [Pseudomonadota bacterium]
MPDYLIWLIAGLALIIIEVMTGTFFLLVLGIAAFAGGLAAYWGAGVLPQVVSTGFIAAIGLFTVHRWRQSRSSDAPPDRPLDVGEAVTLESWVDQSSKRIRVKYRGTAWDAQLVGDANVQLNDTLYICGVQGSQLKVSRSPTGQ